MFGNMMGWIISAVITALAGVLTYSIVQAGVPTAPTAFVETATKPLMLTGPADAFLKLTDSTGEAGQMYREAVTDYGSHADAYDALQHNQDYDSAKSAAEKLKGLQDLIHAADARCIGVFSGKPDAIINFDAKPDALEALDGITKTAGMMSALAKVEKDYPSARQYARGILVLGIRLYQERLAYVELEKGKSLISLGIAALINVDEADPAASAAVPADRAFQKLSIDESSQVIDPIAKVFFTLSDANVAEHAGDMFQIATGVNYDRVWRVEAIHRLGRLRYNSVNFPDQLKAPRILAQITADPKEDPIIHLAADQALHMTRSDFQSIR